MFFYHNNAIIQFNFFNYQITSNDMQLHLPETSLNNNIEEIIMLLKELISKTEMKIEFLITGNNSKDC